MKEKMRKNWMLIAAFAAAVIMSGGMQGCATTQNGQPVEPTIEQEQVQDALIEVTSRRLAFYVGRNNPKIIEPGIAFCSAFEGPQADLGPLLAQGLGYLDKEVAADPLIKADLETILKLLNVAVIDKDIPLTDRQKALIRLGAKAFKLGLETAKANPK
jgi:hypothetical protein